MGFEREVAQMIVIAGTRAPALWSARSQPSYREGLLGRCLSAVLTLLTSQVSGQMGRSGSGAGCILCTYRIPRRSQGDKG